MFSFRIALADMLYCVLSKRSKKAIVSDVEYYCSFESSLAKKSDIIRINYALIHFPMYRNIFYYRIRDVEGVGHYIGVVLKWIFPELKSVEIYGNIGEKLVITHNSAVINVYKAGNSLTVHPYAVIGKGGVKNRHRRRVAPTIGNRVCIGAGALVIGGIQIGNDVSIGAGCLVKDDVPSDCVVVGNPARIINLRGQKCDILLEEYHNFG